MDAFLSALSSYRWDFPSADIAFWLSLAVPATLLAVAAYVAARALKAGQLGKNIGRLGAVAALAAATGLLALFLGAAILNGVR